MTELSKTDFTYSAGTNRYRGVLLNTSGSQAKAAVVLLPDWRGQSPLAFDHARHLVQIGCMVVIADLYGDGYSPESPDQVGLMVKRLIDNRHEGVAGLAACVMQLKQQTPTGTPIICLGFSAGGMVALDYGRSGANVAGIVLCSALLKTAAEGMNTRISAPVLILQGTQDQVSSLETITAIIAEMDVAGNDVRMNLYSQTHHAFDNPEAGTDHNARLVYSPTSARRATNAISAFVIEVAELR